MVFLLALLAANALPSQAQLEAALGEAVAASCPRSRVVPDADLTRACQSYVAAAAQGSVPVSGSAVSYFASLESYEPAPIAGVATVSPPSNVDRAIAQLLPQVCRYNRTGIAASIDAAGQAVACVLVADHATELEKIPGRVRAGDRVTVSGTLGPGMSKPRIFVTRPNGEVEEIALESERLLAVIPLREKGEHSIEVLADTPAGPQVAALRRVFAGVAPPAQPPKLAQAGTGLPRVEALINQLRAGRGLPQLQRDAELDEVAAGHSKEMARTRTFAHVLASDGSLGDRLKAKGWAYRSAGENIGLSEDAVSAHEAIVSSPAHLSNLLDPRHRRLGLGAVKGPTADGGEGLYLTEVLASPIVGAKDPVAAVAKEVQRQRQHAGLEPLIRDPMLDYVAGHEVRASAMADDPHPRPGATSRALAEQKTLESAVVELYVASSPDEITSSKNLAEPQWTRLGVGAIYASSKQFGPGRLWVVLIYGR
ncbi:MAG TPA: CAP domain-containing protein [Myxococcales bacterium]|jgi:uncharacterized protein YkwD|nr:CAP domain-containing protein [Myxococcales bacterium]